MNKEEIEILKGNLEYMAEYEVDIVGEEHIKEALKYIDELEQKSEILDKVTDKLKEDANQKVPLAEDMDWVRCRKEYAREILNIIEGEKK